MFCDVREQKVTKPVELRTSHLQKKYYEKSASPRDARSRPFKPLARGKKFFISPFRLRAIWRERRGKEKGREWSGGYFSHTHFLRAISDTRPPLLFGGEMAFEIGGGGGGGRASLKSNWSTRKKGKWKCYRFSPPCLPRYGRRDISTGNGEIFSPLFSCKGRIWNKGPKKFLYRGPYIHSAPKFANLRCMKSVLGFFLFVLLSSVRNLHMS